MSKNVLVTLADENYIEQAKQLFSSVYHNSGWKGDYLLLAHNISEKDLKWFREKGILVKNIPKRITDLNGNWSHSSWSSAVLSKFYLFSTYFKKWKRVIFLDGDIYVRGSLDELLKVKGFGAADDRNDLNFQFFGHERDIELYSALKNKYNLWALSFNVGVMSINTKIIKKNTCRDLIKMYKKFSHILSMPEQAIFNLYFFKKWEDLDLRKYNYRVCNPRKIKFSEAFSRKGKYFGSVIHFIGGKGILDKPWNSNNWFHLLWKKSLRKAKDINLEKRKEAINEGVFVNIFRLRGLFFYRKFFNMVHYPREEAFCLYHSILSKMGKIIKKISPRLYESLGGKHV